MTIEAADPAERPRSSSTPTAGDVVLAVVVVAVAVAMQVTGLDSIPANRDPDALGVLLTVAAVAPLAWRRVRPLAVLVAAYLGHCCSSHSTTRSA